MKHLITQPVVQSKTVGYYNHDGPTCIDFLVGAARPFRRPEGCESIDSIDSRGEMNVTTDYDRIDRLPHCH